MPIATLARPSVTITEELRAEAARVLEQVGDEKFANVTITTETGRRVDVSPGLSEILDALVHRMEQGGRVMVESMPELLTTTNAAAVLGISRPTLVKLIDDGALPAVMRGTHRRVRWSDLMAFREAREEERSVAITDLLDSDFGGD